MTDVRLGGYPAKKCPRVTHNDYSPDSPEPLDHSPELERLFDEGNRFEVEVTADLARALGDKARVLIEEDGRWSENIDATMDAMRNGVPVIINGRLPEVDGRVGAPDVLVRVDGGYLPVDIKNHSTFGRQKTLPLTWSSLGEPATRVVLEGEPVSSFGHHRSDDTLQLAHYTRMLQGLGLHPVQTSDDGAPWGGIIGTSDFASLDEADFGIVWHDLSEPYETTYSASAPDHRKQRSAMERYDHEFNFRLDVARAAREGRELVIPIGHDECPTCVWREYCAEVVGPDDASFALTTGLPTAREWLFIHEHGGDTIEGLAAFDVDGLAEEFAAHSGKDERAARARLATAVDRARMIRDGIDVEPRGGAWPTVPSADVEIDFDIEWDHAQRIYQYGIRVRRSQDEASAEYQPAVSFDVLDEASEVALADECADRLEQIIDDAESHGLSVAIYHWFHVEVSRTKRFPRLAAVLGNHTVDLCEWTKDEFLSRDGYSIKSIAPMFGFSWGLDDAGGFTSMDKIATARGDGNDAATARDWCLTYNEADVAAQAAIRDGLRQRSQARH